MTLKEQLIEAKKGKQIALRLIAIRAGLAPSTVTRIAKGKTADVMASTHRSIVEAISELSTQKPSPARRSKSRKPGKAAPQ